EGQPDFVKIVDFGIAKMLTQLDGEDHHLTQTGEVFGSPLYMSPEQCRGKELDARSDIYSIGCVIYRTLAGIPPFSAQDMIECMYKQVTEAPPSFSSVAPDLALPRGLEEAVFKSLDKDPAKRYQSMQEFKETLEVLDAAVIGGQRLSGALPQVYPKS